MGTEGKWTDERGRMVKTLPAIPPNDYKGSIADWIVSLIDRGLMRESQFYGDITLTVKTYDEILTECEKDS